METAMVNTKLGLVEYSTVGAGKPILLLHGGHSNSKDSLAHKGLDQKKYHLITPSRPGYGRTPLAHHETPEKAADLFVALFDELSIGKTVVYGISAGGYTALAMAAKYPGRVEKLILASAVTQKWLDKKGKTYKMAKKIFNPKVERLTWGFVHLFSALAPGMIARSFYPEFSSCKDVKISRNEAQELASTLQKYRSKAGFVNDIDQHIADSILEEIVCPTLVLHSQYDASVPVEHAQHAYATIQNASMHLLQNKWGHMIWLGENYKETLGIITNFIDEK